MDKIVLIVWMCIVFGVIFALNRKKNKNKETIQVVLPKEKPLEIVSQEQNPTLIDGEEVIIVKDGARSKGKVVRVAQGIQIWNSEGVILLDYSQPTYIFYGQATASGNQTSNWGTTTGSIFDSRIRKDSTFIIPTYVTTDSYSGYYGTAYPKFIIEDGKISWEYKVFDGGYYDVTFIYGGLI